MPASTRQPERGRYCESVFNTEAQYLGNLPTALSDRKIVGISEGVVCVTVYKHSGCFTVGGAVLAFGLGLAGGLPLAFLYSWGVIRIPEVKLACIATMVYGALVGVTSGVGAKWGKVRNGRVAAAIAICVATGSLYCSWAFWVRDVFHTFAHKEVSALALMQRPWALWNLVKLINQYGTWGMSQNSPTTGTELWVIWVLEAVTVLGAAGLAAAAMIQAQPFCETCRAWCSSSEKLCLSPVSDLPQTKLLLEQHDLSFLQTLGPGNKKSSRLNAELHSCRTCGELNTLTVQQVTVQPRKLGSPEVKTVNLASKLLISRQEADAFRQTAQGHKQLSLSAHA